jgi:hypothetical protein
MAHDGALHNPTTNSQCARILAWLQLGKPITAHVARSEFGCDRLAARIKDLRNDGHTIHTKTIKVFNREGQPCRVAEYWLVEGGSV